MTQPNTNLGTDSKETPRPIPVPTPIHIEVNFNSIIGDAGYVLGRDYRELSPEHIEQFTKMGIENPEQVFIVRTLEEDGMFGKLVPISDFILLQLMRCEGANNSLHQERARLIADRVTSDNLRERVASVAMEAVDELHAIAVELKKASVSLVE